MHIQNFDTEKWNQSDAPPNVSEVVAAAIVDSWLGSLSEIQPIRSKVINLIKAQLTKWVLPRLMWRTRVEGSCDDLCNTVIDVMNQYLDRMTVFTEQLKIDTFGISAKIQLKAQVSAGNYVHPCPCQCTSNPRHVAWEEEKKQIEEQNAAWEKAHQKWLKDMKDYQKLIKEKGSAFEPNGDPYPTPQWPPEVDGLKHEIPPEPPPGARRCRNFHIIWTADIEASASIAVGAGGTLTKLIAETTELVCTPCCDKTAKAQ